METRRWINQGQPQTMQIAVFLLYFNAVFTLILGGESDAYIYIAMLKLGVTDTNLLQELVRIVISVALGAAGFLIANERKWGYRLGVIAAALPLVGAVVLMLLPTMNDIPRFGLEQLGLITLLFDVALFALLVHPQSRDYERIWFK
jgi:hypothetical protein